ncbi:MAG: hypothetical protein KAS32_18480 [Candidatus Peribacteraceae bacterium]|nr:hypothetical protein [Candidatus Peribacteraceae bacterium]
MTIPFLSNRPSTSLAGIFFALVLIFGFVLLQKNTSSEYYQANIGNIRRDSSVVLAPCTLNDIRYSHLSFPTKPLEEWSEDYNTKVNEIIEEELKPTNPEDIDCMADSFLSSKASNATIKLAEKLPPWQGVSNIEDNLKKSDVGFVLLEYLRIYECALEEKDYFLNKDLNTQQFERDIIRKQLLLSRPVLERALAILSGETKLSSLDAELVCMQRASLDARNGLALSADASACLPRTWESKDVLRDIKESHYVPSAGN